MKHALFGFVLVTAVSGVSAEEATTEAVDLQALARRLDDLYRADSSRGVIQMQIKTPHFERELQMKMWTQGRERALIRIRSPRKEKGITTLKHGSEMWNYLPKIGKTIRIPPSMMSASWMGSDLTNDDLVRDASWETDYNVGPSDAPAGEVCIRLTAKPDAAVVWPTLVACLDRETQLPRRITFVDDKGRDARLMEYTNVRAFGEYTLPGTLTLTPLNKPGHRTIIEYRELEFDVKHPRNLFSHRSIKAGG